MLMLCFQWGCLHISSFALLNTAHTQEKPSPKAPELSVQWENTSTHDATLTNFTTQPLLLDHWFLKNGKRWRMSPEQCAAQWPLTYSSVHFKIRNINFLAKEPCQNTSPVTPKQNIPSKRIQKITPPKSPYSTSYTEIFNISELSYCTINTVINI